VPLPVMIDICKLGSRQYSD